MCELKLSTEELESEFLDPIPEPEPEEPNECDYPIED